MYTQLSSGNPNPWLFLILVGFLGSWFHGRFLHPHISGVYTYSPSILPKSSFRSLLTHTHIYVWILISIITFTVYIYVCVCVSSCVSSLKLYPFLCVLEGSLLDFYSYHFFVFQRFPYFDTHSYHIHSHTFPKKTLEKAEKEHHSHFPMWFW